MSKFQTSDYEDLEDDAVDSLKTPFGVSWFRSNFAAVSATGFDFLITVFLAQTMGLWYVVANVGGALTGGFVSFMLCRSWVFNRQEARWEGQAVRYVVASLLSMLLNTLAVWYLTENWGFVFVTSKVIAAIIIGMTFNFFMFRYFVFR
jgi:putative flippase GtrA